MKNMCKVFKYGVPLFIGGIVFIGFKQTECCSDIAWGISFGTMIVLSFVMHSLVEIVTDCKTF